MRPSTLLAALALPALSLTSPLTSKARTYEDCCLTYDDAATIANEFGQLLTATGANFNTMLANSLLADDFTDTSDSINFLAGIPLGAVTFPSKQAFIAGQGAQPPIGFTVVAIDAVSCKSFAFRWIAAVGSQQYEVKGIDIFYVSYNSGAWQIDTVYSEFNSAAFDLDIGGTCTPPPS